MRCNDICFSDRREEDRSTRGQESERSPALSLRIVRQLDGTSFFQIIAPSLSGTVTMNSRSEWIVQRCCATVKDR